MEDVSPHLNKVLLADVYFNCLIKTNFKGLCPKYLDNCVYNQMYVISVSFFIFLKTNLLKSIL